MALSKKDLITNVFGLSGSFHDDCHSLMWSSSGKRIGGNRASHEVQQCSELKGCYSLLQRKIAVTSIAIKATAIHNERSFLQRDTANAKIQDARNTQQNLPNLHLLHFRTARSRCAAAASAATKYRNIGLTEFPGKHKANMARFPTTNSFLLKCGC